MRRRGNLKKKLRTSSNFRWIKWVPSYAHAIPLKTEEMIHSVQLRTCEPQSAKTSLRPSAQCAEFLSARASCLAAE